MGSTINNNIMCLLQDWTCGVVFDMGLIRVGGNVSIIFLIDLKFKLLRILESRKRIRVKWCDFGLEIILITCNEFCFSYITNNYRGIKKESSQIIFKTYLIEFLIQTFHPIYFQFHSRKSIP